MCVCLCAYTVRGHITGVGTAHLFWVCVVSTLALCYMCFASFEKVNEVSGLPVSASYECCSSQHRAVCTVLVKEQEVSDSQITTRFFPLLLFVPYLPL